jgi:hypothetical protein
MGWSIGYDPKWKRDIGYGVPCLCDQPGCSKEIDRGLSYVCGGEPYGGDHGCGLYFCHEHLPSDPDDDDRPVQLCDRCVANADPHDPKPDVAEWINHKLADESWAQWRAENPDWVAIVQSAKPADIDHHQETIKCPSCGKVQPAIVQHTKPLWTYNYYCDCDCTIGESEWEEVERPPVEALAD